MYDPNKYKKNKVQDDLGYQPRQQMTDIGSVKDRMKHLSPTESPLKEWWLKEQEIKSNG
jgi:hypothetical protein